MNPVAGFRQHGIFPSGHAIEGIDQPPGGDLQDVVFFLDRSQGEGFAGVVGLFQFCDGVQRLTVSDEEFSEEPVCFDDHPIHIDQKITCFFSGKQINEWHTPCSLFNMEFIDVPI